MQATPYNPAGMTDGHHRTRLILERVSRVVEANAGMDSRTIRTRAGVPRRTGDDALTLLLRAGFIERQRVNADWNHTSVKPYRANVEAPRATFSETHSTGEGGA